MLKHVTNHVQTVKIALHKNKLCYAGYEVGED